MRHIHCLLLAITYLFAGAVQGQVWPGDVNDNGIANNVDLIWMGSIYGEEGPQRPFPDQGFQWDNQNLPNPWANDFANGVNYGFADCNGDGEVDFDDHSAIEINYNKTHGTVEPDVFEQGEAGVNPPLFFNMGGPYYEGNSMVLSVNLGTAEQPIDNFYGLAFTIRYDPDIFSSGFGGGNFSLEDNSWLGQNNQIMEVDFKDSDEGVIEVGLARRNRESIGGFGEIGVFFIVIEDHVVGITEPSIFTTLRFENVQLLDENLSPTTIYADSIEVEILNDEIISADENQLVEAVKLYPSPAKDHIWIEAQNQNIEQVRLIDVNGRSIKDNSSNAVSSNKLILPLNGLAEGIYFVKIQTSEGTIVKKILITN